MGTSLTLGTLLADSYRVVRLVGTGGMGEVYEATHERLAGRYAVKVLLAEITGRADIFQRFRREAEVTSGLRHPNIVQVLDFNVTPQGHPYLVMEYLDGVELAEEIRRIGAMPVSRVLDIIGQIASALAAAHSHKIVHRDLKPQNLFLVRLPGEDREVVKVVDFGISKVREATTKLTQETAVMGTPQYMAPEQAEGKLSLIDERTDEFSLAVIAYELITGRSAFHADSVPAIIYQVVHQQPEPIRQISPMVGTAVAAVVAKAMSKNQADRYPTVLAFHRELARAAEADHNIHTVELLEPQAPSRRLTPPGTTTTTLRSAASSVKVSTTPLGTRGRGRVWAGVTGAVVLAAAGGLFLLTRGSELSTKTQPMALPQPAAQPSPAPVPPTPTPKVATVEVENAPAGLQVTVDGAAKELPVKLPWGPAEHSLVFTAEGYKPTEVRVDGLREHRSLVLTMQPVAASAPNPVIKKRPSSRPAKDKIAAAPEAPKSSAPPTPASAPAPSKPPGRKAKLITDF